MANEKILVVDDDKNICELLRLYLVKEGFAVTLAHDGKTALQEFDKIHPDMVLLDVMMPDMDGWEVCRRIRQEHKTPIIMLTAKGETYDKVLGLELGADDYIVKPFETKEVTARIKAVLRRCAVPDEDDKGVYSFDNLHLDMNRYELKVKGKVVDARPRSWNCWPAWPVIPTGYTPATSCWTRCGDLSITATPAPSTYTSSACVKAGGRFRPVEPQDRVGRWVTSSR